MVLPLIGTVSIPDIIFALFLLAMFGYGLFRGLGHEVRGLLAAVLAAGVSLYPDVHSQAVTWCRDLAFFDEAQARALAYIGVYYLLYVVLRLIMAQFKTLREAQGVGMVSRLLGGFSGLLRGVMDCTMFLILAAGWRLPLEEVFKQSHLADFIVDLWHQFGLLGELYAAFTLLKFSPV
ncbi:MAG: CvpA family protein [Deltaproteobacteria bacterium]|jgi:uncharacterized membrane protein required for colicin V production|nr:CvpA family protein [Deltaproteobacteria bacterium]